MYIILELYKHKPFILKYLETIFKALIIITTLKLILQVYIIIILSNFEGMHHSAGVNQGGTGIISRDKLLFCLFLHK